MKSGVIASPEEVEMMVHVLDAYCEYAGIVDYVERENVAALILVHYARGIETEDGLMSALLSNTFRRAG